MPFTRVLLLICACLAIAPQPVLAQSSAGAPQPARTSTPKQHRVVIQISQNDPAVMTTALNNAENLVKFFADKGEKVQVEFVAYGAGLAMMRADTSPVKDRLATLNQTMKNVTFSGCANTMANQSKAEGKEVTLLPEARVVPTGIGRIVELSEQGWTYVRP